MAIGTKVAFNVLPQVENFKGGYDYTTEERKVMAETRKILGLGDEVGISANCARVSSAPSPERALAVQRRSRVCRRGGTPGDGRKRTGRPSSEYRINHPRSHTMCHLPFTRTTQPEDYRFPASASTFSSHDNTEGNMPFKRA